MKDNWLGNNAEKCVEANKASRVPFNNKSNKIWKRWEKNYDLRRVENNFVLQQYSLSIAWKEKMKSVWKQFLIFVDAEKIVQHHLDLNFQTSVYFWMSLVV